MEEIIQRFLQVSYGYGDGSGSGYGYGSGSDDGSGYGYGDGSGYGSGDGSGSGYGYGSDSGDGYGDGYGDGIEEMNGDKIYMIDGTPTFIDSIYGNYAKGRILNSDLATTSCYIAKVGDFFAHGDTLREAMRDAESKYNSSISVEERISLFNKQFPDREKLIPASDLFQWHNTLTGSCLAGRKRFCKEHNIDYEHGKYTVNYFIILTKNAYGGEIIKQLEDSRS